MDVAGLKRLSMKKAAISVGATAQYNWTAALAEKYAFTDRMGETVLLHKREGNIIHLPRELCPPPDMISDARSSGPPVTFPHGPEPRDYQHHVFDQVLAFLKAGESGIVHAPTGWGKTALGYHCIHGLGLKTLIVCTKDDVYQQWIKDAPLMLGVAPHEVGELRQKKCEVGGTKVCVGMIHSIAKGNYTPHIMDEFGLVIFDEVHRLPSDHFGEVVTMLAAKLRLGLSAQVNRPDGRERLVHAHIGPVRVEAPEELMIPRVLRYHSPWRCPIVTRNGEKVKIPHEPGKTAHIDNLLAKHEPRNAMLVDLIATAFHKGRANIIFSKTHEHLHALEKGLLEGGISPAKIGWYIGASTKAEEEKREAEKGRPILLSTYIMAGEGSNLPWLDTCTLAMPYGSAKQPVGRIRRIFEGKSFPVVLDVMDTDSWVFAGYAANRMKWYSRLGCEIIDMD